jgi:parvulin-like peptidyl-prolyl isomerase
MAALVNGEGIPLAEWDAQVTQYIAAHEALGKPVTEEDASQAVLEDLIAQVLLAQSARLAGLELAEDELAARIEALGKEVGGAAKLSAWQSAHGYTDATFPLALKRAAEAAYMRDKIVTAVPSTAEQVHVQQILVYNESRATVLSNQLKGGVDFDALAAVVDPSTRGELSWFPRRYLLEPAIEEAAFSMEVGEVSEIISTQAGFHIIKVLERDADRLLSPDAQLALQELALKEWVAKERAAAHVVLAP